MISFDYRSSEHHLVSTCLDKCYKFALFRHILLPIAIARQKYGKWIAKPWQANSKTTAEVLHSTSHKKFSEGKQVHLGMEASKTNQTRWE